MAPHARRDQRDGDLRQELALLQEAGYSGFSLGGLAAVRQSAAFRKLQELWAAYVACGKQLRDLEQVERAEFLQRFRDLSIAAGAAAGWPSSGQRQKPMQARTAADRGVNRPPLQAMA
jgi:hypothetical protein